MEDFCMNAIYLSDIVETLGKWIDADFDIEVPIRVVRLLEEAYAVSVNELNELKELF